MINELVNDLVRDRSVWYFEFQTPSNLLWTPALGQFTNDELLEALICEFAALARFSPLTSQPRGGRGRIGSLSRIVMGRGIASEFTDNRRVVAPEQVPNRSHALPLLSISEELLPFWV